MQADQITSLVFSKLIRQGRGRELLELLDFLNWRVYSKLDSAYEPTIRKLQVSLVAHALAKQVPRSPARMNARPL